MPTLLIVDDEPEILELLRVYLRGTFSRVMVASTGGDAFNLITTEHVDVVLTDVEMPGMRGLELVDRIRALKLSPAILVMSGSRAISRKETELMGALAFLEKPFDFSELDRVVKTALRGLSLSAVGAPRAS